MAFCFSGSLLRANFNIVFFLFYIDIVRGNGVKLITFCSLQQLRDFADLAIMMFTPTTVFGSTHEYSNLWSFTFRKHGFGNKYIST